MIYKQLAEKGIKVNLASDCFPSCSGRWVGIERDTSAALEVDE